MELPAEGVVVRSAPSGWSFAHTVILWAGATAVTLMYYFLFFPPASPWLALWAPAALAGIKGALKIPPWLAMLRATKYLILYSVGLVTFHLPSAYVFGLPDVYGWTASMVIPALVILGLEIGYAYRVRKSLYAVGLYADRFEYEEPGLLKSWPWKSVSVFWDKKAKEYVVAGPRRDEVRLRRDMPRRGAVVACIEEHTGRRCEELL